MKIKDRVYGPEEIKEEVLIDIINSGSMQRLKGVSQLGMPDKYFFKKGFSRYEHSLGVLILLRKLGAGLEEQVSGLLHDVSHTTFSHVIDWIYGDPEKDDYQDKNLFDSIKNSNIKNILEKKRFNYQRISNHENFPLLERETPGLCADRIDYCLREIALDKKRDLSKRLYENLRVKNNQVVFKNKEIAEIFAKEYMGLQKKSWASDKARASYYLLSNTLKEGLEKNILSLEDFQKTESHVLNILENQGNGFILENLNLLKKGFKIIEDKKGVELKKKFRYIDPEVTFNNHYKKLSELSKKYNDFIESEKENSKLNKKVLIKP